MSESDSNEIPIYRCSCHGARSGSENLQMHEAWDAVSLSLNSRGVLQLGPSTYAVAKAIAAAGTSKPGQRPMPSTSA